jgi:hypothetical protein
MWHQELLITLTELTNSAKHTDEVMHIHVYEEVTCLRSNAARCAHTDRQAKLQLLSDFHTNGAAGYLLSAGLGIQANSGIADALQERGATDAHDYQTAAGLTDSVSDNAARNGAVSDDAAASAALQYPGVCASRRLATDQHSYRSPGPIAAFHLHSKCYSTKA